MQMLFDASEEDRDASGLGVIPGTIRWIPPGVKRPQMQWNRLAMRDRDEPMFAELGAEPWVYFVHSLHGVPDDPDVVAATCEYGGDAQRRVPAAATCSPPSSTPRSRARRACNCSPTSCDCAPRDDAIELYPAIDLRGGRVVRLTKGDYAAETVYGDDPVAVAVAFADAGATWVHVVDLDAARTGDPVNRPVVARIAAALAGRCRLQTGGGVRTPADVEALAGRGRDPCRDGLGGRRATRRSSMSRRRSCRSRSASTTADGELAVHGWTEGSGIRLAEALSLVPVGGGVRDHRHRPRRHARRARRRRPGRGGGVHATSR